MIRYIFPASIITLLILSVPLLARDFTRDDFDPADPAKVEEYRDAVVELMKEMTIYGEDSAGNELFTAVPFPLELVALMTQLEIHESNITDPDELDLLLTKQNYIKPASNSFAFVLDGDPAWVTGDVRITYVSANSPDPVELPVVNVETENPDEMSAVTIWAVVIEDSEQMNEFMDASEVYLVVGNVDQAVEPLVLDCGFWRLWGLFDLREEISGPISSETTP
jgi:hypothetical protein